MAMLGNVAKLTVVGILIAAWYKVMLPSEAPDIDIKLVQTKEATLLNKSVTNLFPVTGVITVIDHKVYVANGYALANIIMIEGTDGIIIVDTTESGEIALNVLAEFRKITEKPIKGIVITHFHTDHIFGAAALIEAEKDSGVKIQVFMHSSTEKELKRYLTSAQAGYKRGTRQFGVFLDHTAGKLDSPFGRSVHISPTTEIKAAKATQTFEKEETYTVAGVTFTLMHTPGETSDHIALWIPDLRIIMPGDNIYECFPNLYTIRGSPPRDFKIWYHSLDRLRRLRANYLVPSHATPVKGESEIFDILTHYRDAIQFVNDQTLRWLNQGLEIDEVVERVQLPPVLKSHRFLSECYGQVSWCVRGMHSGVLGWFDGDPVYLNPLSKQKRADRLAELLGTDFGSTSNGIERLLLKAKESLEKSMLHFNSTGDVLWDDLQWGLELSANALKASTDGTLLHSKAKNMTITSLKLLATSTVNNNARNYYLSYAHELESGLKIVRSRSLDSIDIKEIMGQFQYQLKAEACDDKELVTVIFEFSDVGQTHAYTLRHCVLEYNTDPSWIPKDFDTKLTLTSIVWKSLLSQKISLGELHKSGDLVLKGSMSALLKFMSLLK